MEFWQELLSASLKTAIWALAIYFLGRFSVTKLEGHLGKATERLRKVGSVEFDPTPPPQTNDPTNPIATDGETGRAIASKRFDGQLSSIQINQLKPIREWLETLDPSEREDQLAISLANWQISWNYEVFYTQIYGSQLTLLSQANTYAVPESQARSAFDAAKASNPMMYGSYEYEGWTNWMIISGLVIRQSEHFQVTEYGREFLRYIVGRGYSQYRLG